MKANRDIIKEFAGMEVDMDIEISYDPDKGHIDILGDADNILMADDPVRLYRVTFSNPDAILNATANPELVKNGSPTQVIIQAKGRFNNGQTSVRANGIVSPYDNLRNTDAGMCTIYKQVTLPNGWHVTKGYYVRLCPAYVKESLIRDVLQGNDVLIETNASIIFMHIPGRYDESYDQIVYVPEDVDVSEFETDHLRIHLKPGKFWQDSGIRIIDETNDAPSEQAETDNDSDLY